MNLFKRLFCKHKYEFVRNIHGDEINWRGGKRSIWKCKKCGRTQYRNELYPKPLIYELKERCNQFYKNRYNEWLDMHKESCDNIIKGLLDTSNKGIYWFHIILVCNEETNDKYYYEKFIKSLGVEVEFESISKENTTIQRYNVHMRWN